MHETHASSSVHVHVVKFIKCLYYYTSACQCVLGGNRALIFSMKLSNANPVSTWIGDILIQQCSVECSCIFI